MKMRSKGFTIPELLIVVAIIAALVAIAIPIFNGQIEKSRETVDFADARTAYTAVLTAAIDVNENARFGDDAILQSDGSYRAVVYPIKQRVDGWSSAVDSVSIGGVPSSEWLGEPQAGGACTITYNPETDETTVRWGTGYTYMSLMALAKVPNSRRIAEDQKTLTSLGAKILEQHWSKSELKSNLGLPESTGNAFRIADYYQEKTGSYDTTYESAGFRVTSKPGGKLLELLSAIGYDGGAVKSTTTDSRRTNTTYTNPLFFSNELAANHFQNYDISQTKRSIIISDIVEKNGMITGMTIYSKAMDHQADLNAEQKKLFSFALTA